MCRWCHITSTASAGTQKIEKERKRFWSMQKHDRTNKKQNFRMTVEFIMEEAVQHKETPEMKVQN